MFDHFRHASSPIAKLAILRCSVLSAATNNRAASNSGASDMPVFSIIKSPGTIPLPDAVAKKPQPDRLAVWVLNITRSFTHSTNLETVRVPGGNNPNLAAQAGVFTLLRQEGARGRPFHGETSLDGHFLAQKSRIPIPMLKITLPVAEA